jgi:hypothetical protein
MKSHVTPSDASAPLPSAESRAGVRSAPADISTTLRVAGLLLRALFLGTILVIIARVSIPQSESIWTVYETPGDLARIALGGAVGLWIMVQLFTFPKEAEAYRTWIYLGVILAPLVILLAIAAW